jgi:activating signal cointegrator 1
MKAITIHQPWATLIALGEKKFETRGWATKYRGPIAIHAAKKVDKEICLEEPFRSVLAEHGYTADDLPTGAVVALCNLSDCLKVEHAHAKEKAALLSSSGRLTPIKGNEVEFGWYDSGRYAWEMVDVKQINPVPAQGQQGLWNWRERDGN